MELGFARTRIRAKVLSEAAEGMRFLEHGIHVHSYLVVG